MKRTRLYEPYIDGRTTFPDRKRPGVYMIHKDQQLDAADRALMEKANTAGWEKVDEAPF